MKDFKFFQSVRYITLSDSFENTDYSLVRTEANCKTALLQLAFIPFASNIFPV